MYSLFPHGPTGIFTLLNPMSRMYSAAFAQAYLCLAQFSSGLLTRGGRVEISQSPELVDF